MSFAADMAKIRANLVQRETKMVQGLITSLADGVSEKSPVDTGLFRGNWMVGGIDALLYPQTTEVVDPSGILTRSRLAVAIAQIQPGGYTHIYNAVPYAQFLVDGGSQRQAPAGVVGPTSLELMPRLRRVMSTL